MLQRFVLKYVKHLLYFVTVDSKYTGKFCKTTWRKAFRSFIFLNLYIYAKLLLTAFGPSSCLTAYQEQGCMWLEALVRAFRKHSLGRELAVREQWACLAPVTGGRGIAGLGWVEKEPRKSPGTSQCDVVLEFRIVTLPAQGVTERMWPKYRMTTG